MFLQLNFDDLAWFRWVFDAIDGQKTSRLSDEVRVFSLSEYLKMVWEKWRLYLHV